MNWSSNPQPPDPPRLREPRRLQPLRAHLPRTMALAAIALLSAPSALGVVAALTPTRGAVAAWMAAVGFELVYLAVATLAIPALLRVHARSVALVAVATAILLNVVADYALRNPQALRSADAFVATFDPLLLALALIESAPLAGLAYALATLLHRIASHSATQGAEGAPDTARNASADAAHAAHAPADVAPPVAHDAPHLRNGQAHPCPRCGAPLRSQQAAAAAARHGGCVVCRNVMSSRAGAADRA